jgi:hypothetical protein
MSSSVKGSPVVADINGDNHAEIFIGSFDTKIYGLNGNGQTLKTSDGGNFPVNLGSAIFSSGALADLDGDGNPSLIIGSYDHKLYSIEAMGSTSTDILWQQFRGDTRQRGIADFSSIISGILPDLIFQNGFDN